MKLLIASDIHGSAYYCDLLMKQIEKENPDKIVLLGDHLYHGPRNDLPKDYDPKQVLAMLNSVKDKVIAVRGNCDSEVDQMVLQFPTMADYCVIEVDDKTIYASHGHIYNQDNPVPYMKGILLCGHSHVPACIEYDNITYINPGSVSIPKDNSKHSYMIYEDSVFKWIDLEIEEVYKEFKS